MTNITGTVIRALKVRAQAFYSSYMYWNVLDFVGACKCFFSKYLNV